MPQGDLDLCNLAIARVGGEPIDALDEDTPLGAFCATGWPQKRDWLLGKHRWTFAAATAQLARRATTPADCPRRYAFDLPSDIVGAVQAWRQAGREGGGPGVRAELINGYVACDLPTLWIEYTRRAPPPSWPVWFTELAVVAFAADVARVVQNRALAQDFELRAFGSDGQSGLLADARAEDGRDAPQRTLAGWDAGDLVMAHLGGGFECGLTRQAERYGLQFIDFPPFGEAS